MPRWIKKRGPGHHHDKDEIKQEAFCCGDALQLAHLGECKNLEDRQTDRNNANGDKGGDCFAAKAGAGGGKNLAGGCKDINLQARRIIIDQEENEDAVEAAKQNNMVR